MTAFDIIGWHDDARLVCCEVLEKTVHTQRRAHLPFQQQRAHVCCISPNKNSELTPKAKTIATDSLLIMDENEPIAVVNGTVLKYFAEPLSSSEGGEDERQVSFKQVLAHFNREALKSIADRASRHPRSPL